METRLRPKRALKHERQVFKNKYRFVNVTIRPGFARSVHIIVFPKVEIKKDIMFQSCFVLKMNVLFYSYFRKNCIQFMIFCLLSLTLTLNETEYSKCCNKQEIKFPTIS